MCKILYELTQMSGLLRKKVLGYSKNYINAGFLAFTCAFLFRKNLHQLRRG